MTKQKALSLRQAERCENAREPICKCRCGGRLHGAKRASETGATLAFFNTLPEDDPHYIPSAEAKKEKKRKEREEAQQNRLECFRQLYKSYHEPPATGPLGDLAW